MPPSQRETKSNGTKCYNRNWTAKVLEEVETWDSVDKKSKRVVKAS